MLENYGLKMTGLAQKKLSAYSKSLYNLTLERKFAGLSRVKKE